MTTLLQVLRDLVLAFVAPRAVLVAENLLLRQQVIVLSRQVKRPRLRPVNRWVLASIAGRFRDLLATILVVKPETVIRWHRAGWRPTVGAGDHVGPVAAHPSTWIFAT